MHLTRKGCLNIFQAALIATHSRITHLIRRHKLFRRQRRARQ